MRKIKSIAGEIDFGILEDSLVVVEEDSKWYLGEIEYELKNKKLVFNVKQISEHKYDEISNFEDGVAIAKYEHKFVIINESGKELCECNYWGIRKWKDKLFIVWDENGAGLMDTNGNIVCPVKYYNILSVSKGSACSIKVNDKLLYGIINEQGKVICEPKYDSVEYCGHGIYWTILNGKVEYINEEGKIVSGPIFDKVYNFYGNYAVVLTDNGYGVINKDKELVVIPDYKGIAPFVNSDGGYAGGNFVVPSGFVVLDRYGSYKNISFNGKFRQYINDYEAAMKWIKH
ncbi:MAG: WG repeat-containing protein [Clostridiales bacterium]|nr:WG repeat-containing protein [Clostridiales bacterium]